MTESALYRSVARATGEPVGQLRRLGFRLVPHPADRRRPRPRGDSAGTFRRDESAARPA